MIDLSIDKVLKYEYCELLLGNRKNISKFYFGKKDSKGKDNTAVCEKNAIIILKFAIEEILGWTPQEAEEKLTPEIVQTFKLKQFINQLKWPPEFNKKVDLFFVVWKVYPSYPHLDNKGITESIYEKILNKERNNFPKEFFMGIDGEERLKICITYFAKKSLAFNSEKEIYEFFSDPKKADSFFTDAKLKKYIYMCYVTPLDAIQQIICNRKNTLVFFTFLFSYLYNQQKTNTKKERKKNFKKFSVDNNEPIRPIQKDDYISLF